MNFRALLLCALTSLAFAQTTPDAALTELKAGNARFLRSARTRTTQEDGDKVLVKNLANGQKPFAVVVTCSDSRLDETMIFDQEMGRLFVVREAGNSPDLQGTASVDYAIGHLESKLVVVLGHSTCGAVKAVKEAAGTPLPGNLYVFQESMCGLLESTPRLAGETDAAYVNRLGSVNAVRQAKKLLTASAELREKVERKEVKVVPAYYDLATGRVTFGAPVLPPH